MIRGLLSAKRQDRLATLIIRTGGIVVILLVVAIVASIGLQALPLLSGAELGPLEQLDIGGSLPVLATGTDPRREIVWTLHRDGEVRFTGAAVTSFSISDSGDLVAADHEVHGLVSALTESGQLLVGEVSFGDVWVDGQRTTGARWRAAAEPYSITTGTSVTGWLGVTANQDSDGNLIAAVWGPAGLSLLAWDNEDEEWQELPSPPLDDRLRSVALAEDLNLMAVITAGGRLQAFQLPAVSELPVTGIAGPVTTCRFLIGGGTLIAAGDDGTVHVLLSVPRVTVHNGSQRSLDLGTVELAPGEQTIVVDNLLGQRFASRPEISVSRADPELEVVRTLPPLPATATCIAPSHRRRCFLVGTEDGSVVLYHSTSARRLSLERWSDSPVSALAMAPRGNGALALAGGTLLTRSIDNPHPEASFRTLFLPVWYEGYAAPEWVWQTTGGSDSFEPKMSLWPLLFGTLKATLYAMLLSVPCALLAALYVSQLAPRWLQSTVKPTLELMAAVPSVVVGFLAALWLAPRLERALLAVSMATLALPLALLAGLAAWRAIPTRLRRTLPEGSELAALLLACTGMLVVTSWLAGPVEAWLFDGDLQRYLFTEWGVRYDQRNSIVVGIALGFAVIPVIFTIAEDACSAVPDALINGSRALGATKWQTAVSLVVPAASPGLFAAVMLGLGRAVGETMIVLMAAGNTPVLDLSPLNGMRTMSAAIAVEIPEAPVGGTLFRVLFLTGILLFLLTLVLTTVADLVGKRLRQRYARF